jgi:phosphatidylserine/phosphatidylglycerophosphate/cardiolipin synthase-like enzyme
MTDTAWITIGSLVARTSDPWVACDSVQAYLRERSEGNRAAVVAAGLSPDSIDDFRGVLPLDPDDVRRACDLGAAWASGRRSVPATGSWKPVVTGRDLDPATFERLTAETMIALIIGAKRRIRLFAPFVDARGIDALAFSLAKATLRGVTVTVGYRPESDRTAALARLEERMRREGDRSRFIAVRVEGADVFPHLKLLIVDGVRAYIGSANLTYAALTTNFEVGAMVDGADVAVYDALLDDVMPDDGG